ncbi:MAG: hypothetical protein ACRDZ5_11255, partial [Acidimicrobiales bacterium]
MPSALVVLTSSYETGWARVRASVAIAWEATACSAKLLDDPAGGGHVLPSTRRQSNLLFVLGYRGHRFELERGAVYDYHGDLLALGEKRVWRTHLRIWSAEHRELMSPHWREPIGCRVCDQLARCDELADMNEPAPGPAPQPAPGPVAQPAPRPAPRPALRPLAARAEHVGSLLRPAALLEAREAHGSGDLSDRELKAAEDDAVRAAVAMQEDAGVPIVTDGEMRRESFQSELTAAASGFEGVGMDAWLWGSWHSEHVGDLTLERPSDLAVVERIHRRRNLASEEFTFLRA